MRPREHNNTSDNELPVRRRNYPLFYFQHDSERERSYLRFTPLGVTLILLLTVVPLILILILFLVNSQPSKEPNIKDYVPAPTQTSTPYPLQSPLIIQRPTTLPQPKIRQQSMNVPNPLREPPSTNDNEYPTPNHSPTPQSSNKSANLNQHGL